jgi:hypothetical protein
MFQVAGGYVVVPLSFLPRPTKEEFNYEREDGKNWVVFFYMYLFCECPGMKLKC